MRSPERKKKTVYEAHSVYRTAKTAANVKKCTTKLANSVLLRRGSNDTTVSLRIDRCPSSFRLQLDHTDWTERFHGSAGALQMALESRTATLPVDEPDGVYIRSTRLSNAEGQDVYFHIRQCSGTDGAPFIRSPRISTARTFLPNGLHAGGDTASGLLYGQPLAQVMHGGGLPKVMQHLQTFLQRDECIRVEGIFRIPAKADMLKLAQLEVDRGEMPPCLRRREEEKVLHGDVHIAAGLYKLFFRRMPQPLIPWDSYNAILSPKEPPEIVRAFQAEVPRWPPERRKCMQSLLCFLVAVATHAESNKMSRDSLATVFAPSLLRQKNSSPMDDLNSIKARVIRVKCLLRNYKSIFQSDNPVDSKISIDL